MKKLIISLLFYWVMGLVSLIYAQEEYELGKIVVTPLRYTQLINKIPALVTVITYSEIEKSQAKTIVDLLRPISGLVVRDYYGTGTKTSIDLRGFGEFAGSNTLVLLDGRRLNEIDLSGVDLTQIPLEVIEKIEILRGAGSVLYGDNAVGGVVNIVTKKGEDKTSFKIDFQSGSYELEKHVLELGGSKEDFSYLMQFNRHSTDGYRKNSDYRGEDFFGKIIYEFGNGFLSLSGNYHFADFGLPGALRESQLKESLRRDTKFPDDDVGEEDGFLNLEAKNKITDLLEVNANLSFRHRVVNNYLLSSQSIDHREIDTLSFRPLVIVETNLLGKENKVIGGMDFYWVDSLIDAYSDWGTVYYQGEKIRQTDIDKDSVGYYIQNEMNLRENLLFLLGYRLEKAKYSFDSKLQEGPWLSDPWISKVEVDEDLELDEGAFNLGFAYFPNDVSKIFINWGRSFRFPATDEYYSIWATPPVNTQLLPQISYNYEGGFEYGLKESFKLGGSIFYMRLRNELYYDPLVYTNKNYDKTERRGIELFTEKKISNYLTLTGNYTFMEAIFREGSYSGNQIPLVPRHKFSIIGNLRLFEDWQLRSMLNYCGERYFINDQAHNYPPLDNYITLDLKLSYRIEQGNIYFTINNLFNKKYSEYGAISTVYNERGFYPSPERNFVIGVSYKF
ncbi:MAG: TonB-dependent receptor [Candidatus Omnitrophica bacterium]|nr:TonB-dependent receptor [Candidatus Omnitrophota bacterium]